LAEAHLSARLAKMFKSDLSLRELGDRVERLLQER
jgi:hypothetical protein